jgi:hypothetical protein
MIVIFLTRATKHSFHQHGNLWAIAVGAAGFSFFFLRACCIKQKDSLVHKFSEPENYKRLFLRKNDWLSNQAPTTKILITTNYWAHSAVVSSLSRKLSTNAQILVTAPGLLLFDRRCNAMQHNKPTFLAENAAEGEVINRLPCRVCCSNDGKEAALVFLRASSIMSSIFVPYNLI